RHYARQRPSINQCGCGRDCRHLRSFLDAGSGGIHPRILPTLRGTTRMSSRNDDLFIAAQKVIPGGVNSPVRAFRSVGGTPRFFARGSGARAWDVDGKPYIDYVGSWGPLVLGHAHPAVIAAV